MKPSDMTVEQELQTYGYNVWEIAEMVASCDEHVIRMALRSGALRDPERLIEARLLLKWAAKDE